MFFFKLYVFIKAPGMEQPVCKCLLYVSITAEAICIQGEIAHVSIYTWGGIIDGSIYTNITSMAISLAHFHQSLSNFVHQLNQFFHKSMQPIMSYKLYAFVAPPTGEMQGAFNVLAY